VPGYLRIVRWILPAANTKIDVADISADKKKTYCLYEATSPEAIREL